VIDNRPFALSQQQMDQIRTALLAMKRHARHLAKTGHREQAALFALNVDRIHLNLINLPKAKGIETEALDRLDM
jgi:hypothetical protein